MARGSNKKKKPTKVQLKKLQKERLEKSLNSLQKELKKLEKLGIADDVYAVVVSKKLGDIIGSVKITAKTGVYVPFQGIVIKLMNVNFPNGSSKGSFEYDLEVPDNIKETPFDDDQEPILDQLIEGVIKHVLYKSLLVQFSQDLDSVNESKK